MLREIEYKHQGNETNSNDDDSKTTPVLAEKNGQFRQDSTFSKYVKADWDWKRKSKDGDSIIVNGLSPSYSDQHLQSKSIELNLSFEEDPGRFYDLKMYLPKLRLRSLLYINKSFQEWSVIYLINNLLQNIDNLQIQIYFKHKPVH